MPVETAWPREEETFMLQKMARTTVAVAQKSRKDALLFTYLPDRSIYKLPPAEMDPKGQSPRML